MAKITVKVQQIEDSTNKAGRVMHGSTTKLQVVPRRGDYLKGPDGYAEILRVVHDYDDGSTTLVVS